MKLRTPLVLLTAGALTLAACTPDGNIAPMGPRTQNGAAIGAAIGGLFGATRRGHNKLGQAALGAAVGATIGGMIGANLDKQAADLRATMGDSRVRIVNTGHELIVTMPEDILFDTDSTALRPDLQSELRAVAASLQRYPNTTVDVIGHTDNVGSTSYNQNLSARRAEAVAAVLIDSGVSAGRIRAYGRGEDEPVATNLTPAGRAQNRRVEIIIRPNT